MPLPIDYAAFCEPLKKSDIKVYIRPFPRANEDFACIKFLDKKTVLAKCFTKRGLIAPESQEIERFHIFHTDQILYKSSQEEVYNLVQDSVYKAINGFSTIILGCGQTGSGKTFTMNGMFHNYQQRGISPRIIPTVLLTKKELQADYNIEVGMSFCETHGNEFVDLLEHEPDSIPRTKRFKKFHNVNILKVHSEDQAMGLLFEGAGRRRFHRISNLKSFSNLGTGVVTFYVISTAKKVSKPVQKIGKIHVIDLCGIDTIGNEATVGRSPQAVGMGNKNFCFLSIFILMLRKSKPNLNLAEKIKRYSVLLHFLADSLHNRSYIRFICHIKMEKESLPITLSILRFAQLVQGLEPQMLESKSKAVSSELENQHLKEQLEEYSKQMIRNAIFCENELNQFLVKARIDHMSRLADDFFEGKVDNLTFLGVSHAETVLKILKSKYSAAKEEIINVGKTEYEHGFNDAIKESPRSSNRPSIGNRKKIRAASTSSRISKTSKNSKLHAYSSIVLAKPHGELIKSEGLGIGKPSSLQGYTDSEALKHLKDPNILLNLKRQENLSGNLTDASARRNEIWNEFMLTKQFRSANDELMAEQAKKDQIWIRYEENVTEFLNLKIENQNLQKNLLQAQMERHVSKLGGEIYNKDGLIVPDDWESTLHKRLLGKKQKLEQHHLELLDLQQRALEANDSVLYAKANLEKIFQEYCKENYQTIVPDLSPRTSGGETFTEPEPNVHIDSLTGVEGDKERSFSKHKWHMMKLAKSPDEKGRKWNTNIRH